MNAVRLEDRFWAKVNKTESCWLWTAAIVQRAVALSGFSPWVHGEETTVASQCWVCAGWRKHEDDCEWIALVSAVRGEDSWRRCISLGLGW